MKVPQFKGVYLLRIISAAIAMDIVDSLELLILAFQCTVIKANAVTDE